MKLGELRSAIRNHKGNISVRAVLAGMTVDIPVQKTSFLKDTLGAFGDSKSEEVPLVFNPELGLVYETGEVSDAPVEAAPEDDLPDGVTLEMGDADLLGDLGGTTDAGDDLLGGDLLAETPAPAAEPDALMDLLA